MNDILNQLNASLATLPVLVQDGIWLLLLVIVAIFADVVVKRTFIRLARTAAERSASQWDDIIFEHNVFGRIAQAAPALVVYFGAPFVTGFGATFTEVVQNVSLAWVALAVVLSISALLTSANAIYSTYPVSRDRPIKGFIQVANIVVYILGGVVIISILISKSPVVLLTGFGAMTAVLLLVFRDTILSLVASIQLSSMDMIRVGDWIEMSQYKADGDVIDVALHTVKVQNWDKTITTIPTHKLISESFRNWRGMSESGGRRIKRSINIDVNSVRFLLDEEAERFSEFKLLTDYISGKQAELETYNANLGETANVNLRKLTNLGTFRAYLESYLRSHPRVHQGMTLLVRQRQPGENGIPIEIYCFTNTTAWAEYEGIQADIFDHILAQCGEFGLRVFQAPAGADLGAIGKAC